MSSGVEVGAGATFGTGVAVASGTGVSDGSDKSVSVGRDVFVGPGGGVVVGSTPVGVGAIDGCGATVCLSEPSVGEDDGVHAANININIVNGIISFRIIEQYASLLTY
jgi:hypothetical protein